MDMPTKMLLDWHSKQDLSFIDVSEVVPNVSVTEINNLLVVHHRTSSVALHCV